MAEVKDEFTDNTHYLIFLIPKGDKGDIEPQGLVGTTILDSYASLYEDIIYVSSKYSKSSRI